jgi:hypothetical protein
MADSMKALFAVTGWAFVVGLSGAFFAFGVVSVCRRMKWAPVNITINVDIDLTQMVKHDPAITSQR